MSVSLFAKRRPRRATELLVVASLALLLVSAACCANSAREVQSTVEHNKDPYAYLDMLDEVDLQQMLYEKTHGRVQVSAFRDKKELVAAVRKLEEREDAESSFNERVTAAMQRKAALTQQNSGENAPSAKAGSRVSSSSSPRHHRSVAEESNDIKDSKEQKMRKVAQLMDEEDDMKTQDGPSRSPEKARATDVSAAGGGAGYAGATKASPNRQLAAVHALEVLYCTG